jgi:hypothetical protein
MKTFPFKFCQDPVTRLVALCLRDRPEFIIIVEMILNEVVRKKEKWFELKHKKYLYIVNSYFKSILGRSPKIMNSNFKKCWLFEYQIQTKKEIRAKSGIFWIINFDILSLLFILKFPQKFESYHHFSWNLTLLFSKFVLGEDIKVMLKVNQLIIFIKKGKL